MNSTKKLFGLLLGSCLLFGASAAAQTIASEAGLIGKRYAGFDLAYQTFRSSVVDDAFGGSAVLNVPFNSTIDGVFAFSPTHASGTDYSANESVLSASALTYNRTPYGKAFLVG